MQDFSEHTDSGSQAQTEKKEALFFSVGIPKLIVVNLLTFHFYTLVWMYKNWKYLRDVRGRKVQPFWRTFFAILWVWQLFAEMSETLVEEGEQPIPNPAALALFYILIAFIANLGSKYINPLVGFVGYATIIPPVIVQMRINEANKNRGGVTNSGFTAVNFVCMGLCIAIWCGMVLIGVLAGLKGLH